MKNAISKKQLREFGMLIGLVFPIIIGWLLPLLFGHEFRIWTLWVGITGLILGLKTPGLLYHPYKVWMAIGLTLGWFNSRIILGIVYIIVLLPISFVMRLIGYDPLRRRRKGEKSYRENKQKHQIELTRIF